MNSAQPGRRSRSNRHRWPKAMPTLWPRRRAGPRGSELPQVRPRCARSSSRCGRQRRRLEQLLVGAAADRWNVDPAKCDTADGFVINGVRTFTFGELAEEAADRTALRKASLRSSTKGRLEGQPLQRLDSAAKIDGSWRFAGDVRLPAMLFASVRMAPPGGRLIDYSNDRIEGIAGIRHVRATDRMIAVVADSWWVGERALKAADPKFSGERTPADMRKLFDDALANVAVRRMVWSRQLRCFGTGIPTAYRDLLCRTFSTPWPRAIDRDGTHCRWLERTLGSKSGAPLRACLWCALSDAVGRTRRTGNRARCCTDRDRTRPAFQSTRASGAVAIGQSEP